MRGTFLKEGSPQTPLQERSIKKKNERPTDSFPVFRRPLFNFLFEKFLKRCGGTSFKKFLHVASPYSSTIVADSMTTGVFGTSLK
jgi:hypothetical protein